MSKRRKNNTISTGTGNKKSLLDIINTFYKQKSIVFYNLRSSNLVLAVFTYFLIISFCCFIWNHEFGNLNICSIVGIKAFLRIFGDGIVPSIITFAVSVFLQVIVCETTITDKIVIVTGIVFIMLLYIPTRQSGSIFWMLLAFVIAPVVLTIFSLAACPTTTENKTRPSNHRISA